jgi:hypothetical protein
VLPLDQQIKMRQYGLRFISSDEIKMNWIIEITPGLSQKIKFSRALKYQTNC